MKATFYLVETLTTRVITEIKENEFKYSIKMMGVFGIDPIECIEVVHGIRDGELEIEVYLEIPSKL